MEKDSESVARRGTHGSKTFEQRRRHASHSSVYFHRAHGFLWILLDTLILEVFCGLEEDGGAVFLTRCNLIASLAFNNMLGDFCLFKMSSCPWEPSGRGCISTSGLGDRLGGHLQGISRRAQNRTVVSAASVWTLGYPRLHRQAHGTVHLSLLAAVSSRSKDEKLMVWRMCDSFRRT